MESSNEFPPYDPGPISTRTALVRKKYGRNRNPVRMVVPTDGEITRIALELHAQKILTKVTLAGLAAYYVPPHTMRWAWRTDYPFDPDKAPEKRISEHKMSARFVLKLGKLGELVMEWWGEDDDPPHRFDTAEIDPQEELTFGAKTSGGADGTKNVELATASEETFLEGSLVAVEEVGYERDPAARRACLERYGRTCFVCAFDFGATYGAFAAGFIHVHHLVPLATIGDAHDVDPVRDLRPLCPNCHAAVHIRNPPLSMEELATARRS